MPYFSIIIPTLNSEATLSYCLYGLLNQTFVDFEVLIMDSVSTDSTLSIVEGYQDSRLKVASEPDKGIYDAMNKGIEMAKGEWIYFLGSDDRLYSDSTLNTIYAYLSVSNCEVIYGNVIMSSHPDVLYDGLFNPSKFYDYNICHQSIFYNRHVFEKTGLFNLKYPVLSDYDLNIRWFFNRKIKKLYVDEIIAYYDNSGFSSIYEDNLFLADKNIKFIRYGWKVLSKWLLLQLCKIEANNTKKKLLFASLSIMSNMRKKIITLIKSIVA
jgi:glycosyltransferase involved in cell wall biosynthesis